jgi:hypothetical protein
MTQRKIKYSTTKFRMPMGEVRKKNEQMNLALGVLHPKWNALSAYKKYKFLFKKFANSKNMLYLCHREKTYI